MFYVIGPDGEGFMADSADFPAGYQVYIMDEERGIVPYTQPTAEPIAAPAPAPAPAPTPEPAPEPAPTPEPTAATPAPEPAPDPVYNPIMDNLYVVNADGEGYQYNAEAGALPEGSQLYAMSEEQGLVPVDNRLATDANIQYGEPGSLGYELATLGGMGGEAGFSNPDSVGAFLAPYLPEGYDIGPAIQRAWQQQQGQFGFWSGADDPGQTALKILAQVQEPWAQQATQQIQTSPEFAQSQLAGTAAVNYDPDEGTFFGIPNEIVLGSLAIAGGQFLPGLLSGEAGALAAGEAAAGVGAATAGTGVGLETTVLQGLMDLGLPFEVVSALPALAEKAAINAAMQLATTGEIDVEKIATSLVTSSVGGAVGSTVASGIDDKLLASIASGAAQGATGAVLTGGDVISSALASGTASGLGFTAKDNDISIPQPVINSVINSVATGASLESTLVNAAFTAATPYVKDAINALGNTTQTFDDGSTLSFDRNGNVLGSTDSPDAENNFDNGAMQSVLGTTPEPAPTPAIAPEPEPEHTPEPEPTPKPEPTPEPEPTPAPEPTPEPVPEPTITPEAIQTWEPELPPGTEVTTDDTGSMVVTDADGNVVLTTESEPDRFETVQQDNGTKTVVDTATGEVVDRIGATEPELTWAEANEEQDKAMLGDAPLQTYKDLGLIADDATDLSSLDETLAYLPGGGTIAADDLDAYTDAGYLGNTGTSTTPANTTTVKVSDTTGGAGTGTKTTTGTGGTGTKTTTGTGTGGSGTTSGGGFNAAALLALLAGQQAMGQAPQPEQARMPEKLITPYDWSSIFANKEQEERYISPYSVNAASGGAVDDMVAVNNELLRFLRG